MTTSMTAADKRTVGPDQAPVELVDVKSVGALLGCSTRHVWRLADSGKMPRPVSLGALRRWRVADIRAWIDQGCPTVRAMRGATT